MWVSEWKIEIRRRVRRAPLLPLGPTPTYSVTVQRPALPRPREHLRLRPLLHNRQAKTKKLAQMKEQIKAPEKIQLSNEEIDNISDAEFKTLGI